MLPEEVLEKNSAVMKRVEEIKKDYDKYFGSVKALAS